jgi:hypothetical protein
MHPAIGADIYPSGEEEVLPEEVSGISDGLFLKGFSLFDTPEGERILRSEIISGHW